MLLHIARCHAACLATARLTITGLTATGSTTWHATEATAHPP
ncbi:hypothetical protein [Bifidobacterium asteroides]|nr:hypothetical protein [Bifidobacterium asteroides]